MRIHCRIVPTFISGIAVFVQKSYKEKSYRYWLESQWSYYDYRMSDVIGGRQFRL